MPRLNVTEYSSVRMTDTGVAQVPVEPSITSYNVVFTTAESSPIFKPNTRMVRIMPDADCHFEFGEAPTATVESTWLSNRQAEYFGVPGTDMRISVYDGSS